MIGLLSILTPCLALQLDTERYIQPPQRVAELVTAPWHQNVSLANVSPDGTRSLVARSAGMPTIADLSRPYLNLAGVSVDPAAFRDRGANIRKTLAYEVWTLDGGATVRIEVPEATVGSAEWSPDGRSILLLALYPNGTRCASPTLPPATCARFRANASVPLTERGRLGSTPIGSPLSSCRTAMGQHPTARPSPISLSYG